MQREENSEPVEKFFEIAKKVEKDLGLPEGFYKELGQEERDWTFVIMIHSLLETALAYYLTEEYNKPHLRDTFARLQTANKKTGKLAFLKDTSLEKYVDFISLVSTIRNAFAHDIKNLNLSLKEYLKNPEVRSNYINTLNGLLGKDKKTKGDIYVNEPRLWIYFATAAILETIYNRKIDWFASRIAEWLGQPTGTGYLVEPLADLPAAASFSISKPSLSIPFPDKDEDD